MFTNSKYLIIFILGLSFLLVGQVLLLCNTKSLSSEEINHKNSFVAITSMPDLAIYSNTHYIRHRSLSSIGNIYHDDGLLREYEKGTFIYAINPIYKRVSR